MTIKPPKKYYKVELKDLGASSVVRYAWCIYYYDKERNIKGYYKLSFESAFDANEVGKAIVSKRLENDDNLVFYCKQTIPILSTEEDKDEDKKPATEVHHRVTTEDIGIKLPFFITERKINNE